MPTTVPASAERLAAAAPAATARAPGNGASSGRAPNLMTIGEVARRSGFTIKALRFYERQGLLPASGRTPSGYRVYAEADLHRLEFIRQAKALGLALDAIRELVVAARMPHRGMTRSRLLQVLAERIAQTARQIATLTRLQQELKRRRRTVARQRSSGRAQCTCVQGQGYCACLRERGRAGVEPRAPKHALPGAGE